MYTRICSQRRRRIAVPVCVTVYVWVGLLLLKLLLKMSAFTYFVSKFKLNLLFTQALDKFAQIIN